MGTAVLEEALGLLMYKLVDFEHCIHGNIVQKKQFFSCQIGQPKC